MLRHGRDDRNELARVRWVQQRHAATAPAAHAGEEEEEEDEEEADDGDDHEDASEHLEAFFGQQTVQVSIEGVGLGDDEDAVGEQVLSALDGQEAHEGYLRVVRHRTCMAKSVPKT